MKGEPMRLLLIAFFVVFTGCACQQVETFGAPEVGASRATTDEGRCDCNVDWITLPEWFPVGAGETITLNPNARCFK